MPETKDVQKRIESIEGLIRELDKISDPAIVSLSKQLVQSLMDLHGSGIERMLEVVHDRGDVGQQIIDELGKDDLVSSLLLLYGLHPVDLRTRVLAALEKTRPYLHTHGGSVELVRVTEAGAVTLRLDGSFNSLASTAATLRSTVEQAVYDAAPDTSALVVEGTLQDSATVAAFVPVDSLQANGYGHNPHRGPAGTEAKRLEGSVR